MMVSRRNRGTSLAAASVTELIGAGLSPKRWQAPKQGSLSRRRTAQQQIRLHHSQRAPRCSRAASSGNTDSKCCRERPKTEPGTLCTRETVERGFVVFPWTASGRRWLHRRPQRSSGANHSQPTLGHPWPPHLGQTQRRTNVFVRRSGASNKLLLYAPATLRHGSLLRSTWLCPGHLGEGSPPTG